MSRLTWALALCAGALLLAPCPAVAQPASPGRVDLAAGVRWFGPLDFGRVDAAESTLAGGSRPLFSADSTLDASAGVSALVSVRVANGLRAEGAVSYNPTGLSVRITGDPEVSARTTISAPVGQFLIEGGVLREIRRRGRLVPFAAAGAGYLRQLNDGRTLIETGTSFYGGGGLYYVRESARPRRVKASGVRLDVRAEFLRGGVAPDRTTRLVPAVTAVFFARF